MRDQGQMCYPVPLPEPSKKNSDLIKGESEGGTGVLRIKLVITKQELEVMLKKGGVSVSDLASHMKKENLNNAVVIEDEDNRRCGRWKPALYLRAEYRMPQTMSMVFNAAASGISTCFLHKDECASCFPAKLISLLLKPLDQQHTLAKGRLQVDK
ncbi:hypothetical protein Tco_1414027 [Tanacetum coccineum]